MKTKHNSLILFYAIIFSILSCTEASKQVKKDIEKIETTQTKSAPNLKIIEQNHEFYLSKKIVNSYTLENKIISGDGYHIEFPYVHYYQGDLTEGYTNQLIENFVFSLKPNGRNVSPAKAN